MNINPVQTATFVLLSGTLALAGCNSSNTNASNDTLTITPSNATDTVANAVSSSNEVLSSVPVGAETVTSPSALDIVKLGADLASNDATGTSAVSTPTGILVNIPCSSGSYEKNYSGDATSSSGSLSFSGCTIAGLTLDGSLSYSLDWTNPSGPYMYQFSGDVSANHSGIETTLRSLDYTSTGDTSTGDYTVAPYTYSVSFSGGHGYTVSVQDPIVGNVKTTPECPTSGSVLVSGANGTKAKGTIDYPNVNIEYDDGSGTFTPVDTVPCTQIFPVNRPFLIRYL